MTALRGSSSAPVPAEQGGGKQNVGNPGVSASRIALLTAGRDRPYALGLASALISQGQTLDFIGSDIVDSPELHNHPQVTYLNLRNQRVDAGMLQKMTRVLVYYFRLLGYAFTARPRLFHILWNNKFEWFDRTLLMACYKLLGKKIVFTAHNVNAGIRDANDSFLNRLSLRVQYRLSDHIFVHTKLMKSELISGFTVRPDKVTVIPFGINNTVPNTGLTRAGARCRLGIGANEKTLLFFGRIVPYKGLEYLIEALGKVASQCPDIRLIIAGTPNDAESYWEQIQETIARTGTSGRIIQRIQYIPDEETEIFFKAADVLVLPYTRIFQSGVLFLGYSFGLPAIVADVGSLKEEIVEGRTGFACPARDPGALAAAIEGYFSDGLYKNLENRRHEIREYANDQYSWAKVGAMTTNVYSTLLEDKHFLSGNRGVQLAPRIAEKVE